MTEPAVKPRLNAATLAEMQHEERMAALARQSHPEAKIELGYKKVAGADPLTTWSLEIPAGFDAEEWERMLETATAAHEALLAKFNGAA